MKHVTLLDGLNLDGAPASAVLAPTLLRYDLGPDVVERFFDDLKRDDWLDALRARAELQQRSGRALVDQHVHRKLVLVAVDAACLAPGFPRLDPAKVPEAAMVIRREVGPGADAPYGVQIWAQDRQHRPLGWVSAPEGALRPDSDFDPDAARRRSRLAGRNPALRFSLRITGDADGVSETVHRLFPIPPDIAARIGRSIWFAPLPTTSMAVAPAAAPPPPFSLADVKARVPNLLRIDRDAALLPPANGTVTLAQFRNPPNDGIAALRSTLTWLGQETGFFTGADSAASLRAALAGITIAGTTQGNLRDWFDAANAALAEDRDPAGGASVSFLDRKAGPGAVATPQAWPAITQAQFDAIAAGAMTAMSARWGTLSPSVTRFGPAGDRYHVRCFLRVDDCPGCPPRILWSPLSRSYTIRPWFESAGAPPQMIELPDLGNLADIRPDIAVKVPPQIQQFMDKINLDGLMDGKAPKTSLSFGMICGFSIPIITICAFIILQIFLTLLHIIFFWLPYVKICIPYPIVETEEGE